MPILHRFFAAVRAGLRRIFASGGSGYLCDTCKWDYGDACTRPERPNAKSCPEYKHR